VGEGWKVCVCVGCVYIECMCVVKKMDDVVFCAIRLLEEEPF
jgi:hypothetical protein